MGACVQCVCARCVSMCVVYVQSVCAKGCLCVCFCALQFTQLVYVCVYAKQQTKECEMYIKI